MNRIPDAELILNSDGSIYHLKVKPEQVAPNIILVGDPGRVELVSSFFDTIDARSQNREIKTHTGRYKGKPVTVLSTGMGTDNIDIIMNELDALVNMDFSTRRVRENHTSLNIIRIGTSGALQPEVPVNSFIHSDYAIGLDGILYFYDGCNKILDKEMTDEFLHQTEWPAALPKPYAVRSDPFLEFEDKQFIRGITATAPGFYGPQGRSLRAGTADPEQNRRISRFSFRGLKVLNYEMESSALFGLGSILGHKTMTVCLAIANRATGEFSHDHDLAMKRLITIVLDRISGI